MPVLDDHQSHKEESKNRQWYRDKIASSSRTYYEMLGQSFKKSLGLGVAFWILGSIIHLLWVILLHWGMLLCEDDPTPFDPDNAQGTPKDDYP